jgi:hypothetical protein
MAYRGAGRPGCQPLDAVATDLAGSPERLPHPLAAVGVVVGGVQLADALDKPLTLADHGVLASVGSVGDAYDSALGESFVDSLFKTELIADRVWKTRAQLELPSSSTSAGSTTPGCTRASAIYRQRSSRPTAAPGSGRHRCWRQTDDQRPAAALHGSFRVLID